FAPARPGRVRRGARRRRRRSPVKAARRGLAAEGSPPMTSSFDDEAPHRLSATAAALEELQLYGWRKSADEPDPRPLPEARLVAGAVADMFDALIAALADTRLEPDLEDLLWSAVHLFHRALERAERALDANESAQRRSQLEQDGSEMRSVELERLIAEGLSL